MHENNIKKILLSVLSMRGKITLQEFKYFCYCSLNGHYNESLRRSNSRPNELRLEQRVRNLISHKNLPEGVIYKNQTFYKEV